MIRFGLIIKAMRGVDIPGGDFAVKERFSFAVNFSTNAESSSIGACSMAPKFSAYTVHRCRARRLKLASSACLKGSATAALKSQAICQNRPTQAKAYCLCTYAAAA